MKDENRFSIVNAFQEILDNSKRKPNKIWPDQGSEFKDSQFKNFLKDNNIEMYSTYNEEKSVVVERFIKTFEKLFQKMFILIF